jgi:5-methylcytosine-specific restriction endonuclease McrA
MVRRYRNGWWLYQKYHREGWTQRAIAEECGVSPRTVRKYMKRFGIETRGVEGENHPLHGEEREAAVRERISETMAGREFDEETRAKISAAQEGVSLPAETRRRISESLTGLERSRETRRRMSESSRGEDNANWQGGGVRGYGPGWQVARDAVRDRDRVCRACGHDGSERRLEVHHIVPVRRFRDDPDAELSDAHDLRNLVLLCRSCHVEAEYGDLGFDPPDDLRSVGSDG